jgi:hypothetical protein
MTASAEEAEEIRTQWLTFDCVAEVRVLDESRDGLPSKTRLRPASLSNSGLFCALILHFSRTRVIKMDVNRVYITYI